MCGRYVLALRPAEIRRQLQHSRMPSQEEAPDDEDIRQTYNFAPGYYGLVYRADVPDRGAESHEDQDGNQGTESQEILRRPTQEKETPASPRYKLQAMKWGLVPFWTKRNPDYGSMMKTINCRDDSLATSGGMWNTMKQKKRCVIVAQGFYEWLKKNGGKEKVPHYVKRKDGQLMCFAGLWDCVKFEDAESKLYSYTIITTSSNQQLGFLHDRMPVILNNGSDDIFKWLDSNRSEWTKELQSLLKPYQGELECYPVSKDVGKVGNNSPNFVIPIDSGANKQNIANFFGNQKKTSDASPVKAATEEAFVTQDGNIDTKDSNLFAGTKREHSVELEDLRNNEKQSEKKIKAHNTPRKTKSAISNGTLSKASPTKTGDGNKKITNFLRG